MSENIVTAEELKEDHKFAALIIGGSLAISLITVIIGQAVLTGSGPVAQWVGNGITFLGAMWIVGSTLMGLFIGTQMRNLQKNSQRAGSRTEG